MGFEVQHDRGSNFVSDAADIAGYASWGSNDEQDAGKPFYGDIKGKRYPGTFAPRSLASEFVSTNVVPATDGSSDTEIEISLDVSSFLKSRSFESALILSTDSERHPKAQKGISHPQTDVRGEGTLAYEVLTH